MIQVDRSLYSNVIAAVQRTANMPGGGVSGLPNGATIRGLDGVSSFGSDIQDAQKEFEKGRVQSSLERVRQIESLFQGIVGRWNGSISTILSSARTGRQQLSIQKLNEVKSAQTKMQQLTRPAGKAFQDLINALELAVTNEGYKDVSAEAADTEATEPESATDVSGVSGDDEAACVTDAIPEPTSQPEEMDDAPDSDLLGSFATNYNFGEKLNLKRTADQKVRIEPRFEENGFYYFEGMEPPRVLRVREIRKSSILVFDPLASQEAVIEGGELKGLLIKGVWQLEAKKSRR